MDEPLSSPFPIGDMERLFSSWGYGLAPFRLGISTSPFRAPLVRQRAQQATLAKMSVCQCPIVTCRRWICTYAIENHMRAHHPNSDGPPPYSPRLCGIADAIRSCIIYMGSDADGRRVNVRRKLIYGRARRLWTLLPSHCKEVLNEGLARVRSQWGGQPDPTQTPVPSCVCGWT